MKKFKHILIAGITIVSLALIVYVGNNIIKKGNKEDILTTVSEKEVSVADVNEKIENESLNLKGSISESELISIMHKMTHQKIKADDKWGAVPMTQENIEEVIRIIENSEDFKHDSRLLQIAKKWQKGNFSSADQDHNYLWGLQGGTIGKAHGVATEQEEMEYIAENFKVDIDAL